MDARTRIDPVTLEHADALLAGSDTFEQRFGMAVADGYLDFPEALPATRHALENGTPPEWYSHLIVDDATGTVVGFGGYKGPPVDGEVEIGYSVAPAHRRNGHATAAARLLVADARARGARRVVAHTLAEANPSTRVLRTCGFALTDEFDDEEVGAVWRWELPLLA